MSNAVIDTNDVLADLKPRLDAPPVLNTTRYHVGIFENNPPAWFVALAGITFPVTSSTFDAEDREIRRAGSFVELTVEQVKKVKQRLVDSVVRWRCHPKTGKRIEATIHDRTIPGFTSERNDEPLARYIYFRKAPIEVEQPKLAENTLAMIDAAIAEAEKNEEHALSRPDDARVREQHGRAKASGKKLEDAGI
jgi:hypothetical protein